MTTPIRQMLGQSYGPCREGPCGEPVFRVDDSGGHPIACRLYVTAYGRDKLELEAINLPLDEDVRDLLESKSAQIEERSGLVTCRVRFCIKEVPTVRKFAKAIRRLVGRGRRYDERNWKWICPQTADSLDRLADNLASLRRTLARSA